MGVGRGMSGGSSLYSNTLSGSSGASYTSKNPNPKRFKIERTVQIGKFLIARIRYEDCTNYEGVKILVFKDLTEVLLKSSTSIDPHFLEGTSDLIPIARFAPSAKGMFMALAFAELMDDLE